MRQANTFAKQHLSRQGQQCFAMQLLDGYARMLTDPWELKKLKRRAKQIRQFAA